MAIDTLHDLFVYKLRQQYHVEQTLVETLDHLAITATNDRMSQAFADHRDETMTQVERLEDIFEALDERAEPAEDPLLEAFESERKSLENEVTDDDLLNMVYLTAGMLTERMEMTAYQGLSLLATELDLSDDLQALLESNYDEENAAYRELDAMSTASEMKTLWDRLTPS